MTAGGSPTAEPAAAVICTVLDGPGNEGSGPGSTFPVPADLPVLHAMIRAAQRCIPVGCRGGGCGACRVRVLAGTYATRRMSRRHVSVDDEAEQIVLACRLLPSSDIVVERAPAAAAAAPAVPLDAESP